MRHPLKLSFEIASRFEELDLVDGLIEALLEHLGLDEDERSNLVLAVREAAANAVQHGNRLEADKPVGIEAGVVSDELRVEVRDRGSGFDVDALPDPLAPENLLKRTGRGILLMRNFMDEVTFEFPEAGGTIVLLRKRLPASHQDT